MLFKSFDKKIGIFLVVIFCLTLSFWLLFLTYFAVPFFKLFCQDTGPNGLYGVYNDLKYNFDFFSNLGLFKDKGSDLIKNSNLKSVNIKVIFKINDALPLTFKSFVSNHHILIGYPELLFCQVINSSESDVIFTSIYNVYPSEVLPYLEKIQCFCYDDQIIEKNSTLNLPVYYRINSNFLKDPTMLNVNEIIILYNIFNSD